MASLFQILGVLSALVASGNSLSCIECSSSSNSCTGPAVTCPSGSVCGATYTEMQMIENDFVCSLKDSMATYTMSCISQDKCDTTASMNMGNNLRVKMGISCCKTDRCTPTFPSLPRDVSGSNGVMCPSCVTTGYTSCETSDTMECMGDENTCLHQIAESASPKPNSVAMRGCATKSMCKLSSQFNRALGWSLDYRFICSSGSAGLQKGFYLPAMICIFFLKLWI
ncbi:phospholipase A2 inhibitor and Ly6/PLAUR domain-containing protein-like [Aquarana catesbeiana]|uniref:phospholipase A2 inhibitor and Ly6/PLAUR domain-containing protein-like n=1 Tax=Aquarana catesbeiana TaxID=8400 RepID=UPI003CC9DAEA